MQILINVLNKIKKEISRYKTIMGASSESAVQRGYIETLLELPWNKVSKDTIDMDKAEGLSAEECAGLVKVLQLRNELTDMELQSVYFRGCYDGVGYLKKAGIL